ncbi:hypothetical protein ACLB2K_016058 [Fragaria x ananassa]
MGEKKNKGSGNFRIDLPPSYRDEVKEMWAIDEPSNTKFASVSVVGHRSFCGLVIKVATTVAPKDPTGTIGATIHRKALYEGEIGKSKVGAVLVMQKVRF